ncbi:hypothetical protein JCM8202_001564 [Rhodotorula sphaerocarpa]
MSLCSFAAPPERIAAAAAPNSSSRAADAFFRDARLCPDGSCVLATAEDRSLSLLPLPFDPDTPVASTSRQLEPAWTHKPPDSVLSAAWYPGASAYDPAMFAFAAGVKDHPVQLWDGSDRRVRASYPIVDHTERFVAPHDMTFSPDGSSLYCGFENAIEVFDVGRPGEEGFRMHTTPTRSSRQGQKGIISSLAFSPPATATGSSLLAAGSFSGTVGLYDPSLHKPLVILLFPSQRGGVTKVLFHPLSPHLLFVASRHSTHLDVWDLRNTLRRSSGGRLARKARTNQRLGFDIDPSGTWLAVGDQDGHLSVFSAQPLPDELEPVASFPLSPEPISTTLFHPTQPWLVTTSGTRRFRKPKPGVRERDWLDSGSSDESNEEDGPKRSGADGARDEEDGNASKAAGAGERDADGGHEGGRTTSPIHADALSGADSLGIWKLS